MAQAEETLHSAIAAFDLGGDLVGAVRFGKGHVNDTFCVHVHDAGGDCKRFIFQRVSNVAFHRPDQLMANIVGVTDYLRREIAARGGDPDRETLTFLRTRAGGTLHIDGEGRAWRATPFVEDTVCLQAADSPEQFYAAAKSFGHFQNMLKDYPADTLFETIEKFHDTENRFLNFKKSFKTDALGRAASAGPEIDFILAHEQDCGVALKALRAGALPLRVTHNDTKLNNVLIDRESGEGICVIDLDTVMPGLAINDFGDAIRYGANHSPEDERDLTKVNFDINLFEVYVKGYLEAAGDSLTPPEKEYLPWGAKLMTLECGMRFLTDYLDGDHYFATQRAGQNLDRCRTQFKLVTDMEAQWDKMAGIVRKYC